MKRWLQGAHPEHAAGQAAGFFDTERGDGPVEDISPQLHQFGAPGSTASDVQPAHRYACLLEGLEVERHFLSDPLDDAALVDMEGKDCDLLLVSTNGLKWIYVHDKRFKVEKNIVSGEIESARIYHKQTVGDRDDYYETGAIPTS